MPRPALPDPALDPLFEAVRTELRGAVTDATWHLWLHGLRARELAGDVLVVEAPDRVRAYVADRFGRLLQACAAAVLGPDVGVELVAPGAAVGATGEAAPMAGGGAELNPRLAFDQFILGDANRLAHGAALAVAEAPGVAFNPLFLCGAPGLGKTHLLHSIGHYVRRYGDGLVVRYTTAEAFTTAFVGARNDGAAMSTFKQLHRGVDVLLVDDVQFLQQKVKTEEEFFHTFDALITAGAQIVLTSDQPPRDLAGLEDRLRARFEAGLVTELGKPDLASRLTILRKRIRQDDVGAVDPEAVELIAVRVDESVRALEGALIRVVAYASLMGLPVTAELAAEVLGTFYPGAAAGPEAAPRRTLEEIQQRTCEAFDVSLEELRSKTKVARVAWARQVAMYLSRELTDETLPAIGAAFGRAHTTVMHACNRTAERMADDPAAYEAVRFLSLDIGA